MSERELEPLPESMGQFLGRMLWWVVPVLLIAIGLMLGWADQDAGSAARDDLRIPAMIAALLLFGQGLADLSAGHSKSEEEEAEAAVEQAEAAEEAAGPPPARLLSRGAAATSSPSAVSGLAIGLMVLGVWLGVKVLTVSAPPQLSNLSLLAAFLLFAFGWKVLTRGQ